VREKTADGQTDISSPVAACSGGQVHSPGGMHSCIGTLEWPEHVPPVPLPVGEFGPQGSLGLQESASKRHASRRFCTAHPCPNAQTDRHRPHSSSACAEHLPAAGAMHSCNDANVPSRVKSKVKVNSIYQFSINLAFTATGNSHAIWDHMLLPATATATRQW